MPVIVIGADTRHGEDVVAALLPREGEVRVFVTDDATGHGFRTRGAKVAIGDVSDGSHVGSAALNAFSAVVLAEAAEDDRIRSFADDPEAVMDAWAEGLADAGVRRTIFVTDGDGRPPSAALSEATPEFVVVAGSGEGAVIAAEVAALDDADSV